MSETWSVQDFVVSPHCGDDSQSFLIQVTEREKAFCVQMHSVRHMEKISGKQASSPKRSRHG